MWQRILGSLLTLTLTTAAAAQDASDAWKVLQNNGKIEIGTTFTASQIDQLVDYGTTRVTLRCAGIPSYRCYQYLAKGASVILDASYSEFLVEQFLSQKPANTTITVASSDYSFSYLYRLQKLGAVVRYSPRSARVEELYTAQRQGLELNISLQQWSPTASYQIVKDAGAKVRLFCEPVSLNACKDLIALGARAQLSRRTGLAQSVIYLLDAAKPTSPATVNAYGFDTASLLSFSAKGALIQF